MALNNGFLTLVATEDAMDGFNHPNMFISKSCAEESCLPNKSTLKRKTTDVSDVQSEERSAKRRRTNVEEKEATCSTARESTVNRKRKASADTESESEESSVKRSRPDSDLNSTSCSFDSGVSAFQKAKLSVLYNLGDVLGEGGTAAVYEGVEKCNGRKVAIKIMTKAKNETRITLPGDTHSLPLEVALMELVCKPPCSNKIIQLIDWEETPEVVIMVLERMEPCVELFEFCYNQSCSGIPEQQAKIIIKQVILAALHSHKRGVFHRDIKEENILLNPETLDVKLIDFGCGDIIKDTHYTGRAGTEMYFPPELVKHNRYRAEPSTVWSLGVLLYSMICGEEPFGDSSEISRCKVSFPEHLSELPRDLIKQCLQKKAKRRPKIENLLDHDWFKEL